MHSLPMDTAAHEQQIDCNCAILYEDLKIDTVSLLSCLGVIAEPGQTIASLITSLRTALGLPEDEAITDDPMAQRETLDDTAIQKRTLLRSALWRVLSDCTGTTMMPADDMGLTGALDDYIFDNFGESDDPEFDAGKDDL